MTDQSNNGKLIFSSIIVAAVVVGGAMLYKPGSRPTPPNPATSVDDDAVLGNADAPVTMVIFGDYQCPFCKKAFDTAEAQVRVDYVATGKVKMVFRDYPLVDIHPYARPASEAAQCALPQGKYWEYHDALYQHQSELATLDYVKLAGDLKLDTKAFKTCLDNGTYANEVEKDHEDGVALAVDGTPATFINGKLIPGAYPYATYKQVIDDALKAAQ
jgi:protein-disulfide isomerase